MNKIFKVIFNRTTQKLEVVSELARSKGKAASATDERGEVSPLAGALAGAVLVGGSALLMLSAAPAQAAISISFYIRLYSHSGYLYSKYFSDLCLQLLQSG